MQDDLNILILSCGTRNKIVQYFREELVGKGLVIATDSSELAPALYEADKHYVVPRIDDEGYLDRIFSICKDNKVKAVLSLIDPELNLLAKHKKAFLEIGTLPIVSESDVIELCFDKYKIEFFNDVEEGNINYPVFVKPFKGSASINISKVYSKEEIDLLFNRFDNLMIQEYMDGIEYGVDVYIDMITEEPVSIFIKEKIKMRAGETDKSVSLKDENLFRLVNKFVRTAGFKGIIDIDIFKVNNEYYISEVNPRFGGGYPHAHESNVNIPKMILNNVIGNANFNTVGSYSEGTQMMKYNEVKLINNK